MKHRKVKINSDFVAGYKKGDIVSLQVDSEGAPLIRKWRRLLNNAKHDNCCEFVQTKEPKKKGAVKHYDNESS